MKNAKHIAKYALAYTVLAFISLECVLPFMRLLLRYLWEDLALVITCLTAVIIFGTMDILLNTLGKKAYDRLARMEMRR